MDWSHNGKTFIVFMRDALACPWAYHKDTAQAFDDAVLRLCDEEMDERDEVKMFQCILKNMMNMYDGRAVAEFALCAVGNPAIRPLGAGGGVLGLVRLQEAA